MGCFSALVGGKRKKKRVAKKASANECPKVKPVDDVDVAPCDVKTVPDMVPAAAKRGDMASAKRDTLPDLDLDFRARDRPVAEKKGDVKAAEAGLSPKLKRSCSNIETKGPGPKDATRVPARSRSHGDLPGGGLLPPAATPAAGSPASVKTSRSADRVMLKKRSSRQVLPSRSRKIWWRLFLWSHRNLHRQSPARPASPGHRGGYTSDTLGEGAPGRKNKTAMPPPQITSQWLAFSADYSVTDRVSAWVNDIENEPVLIDDTKTVDRGAFAGRPPRHEVGESSGKGHGKPKRCAAADEVAQANTIIQSLNIVSSVAHISGMGLKVVPMIASFTSLRVVNLSGNFIVHISAGSLPKGLHSLDLSRNKIANIEGLRDLTRLRSLNLSYNRISRIGHGLSSCSGIRELYLAGNKLSDVEGLHRLLKLAVLDLCFNKITTPKALGQLVANYHSLRAINLVGNPVQVNIGDDALRKAVTGLLPQLAYLNKQPVNPQRAREVAADGVARAALEDAGRRSVRRKLSRRPSQSPGLSSARSRRGEGIGRSRSAGSQYGSGQKARK